MAVETSYHLFVLLWLLWELDRPSTSYENSQEITYCVHVLKVQNSSGTPHRLIVHKYVFCFSLESAEYFRWGISTLVCIYLWDTETKHDNYWSFLYDTHRSIRQKDNILMSFKRKALVVIIFHCLLVFLALMKYGTDQRPFIYFYGKIRFHICFVYLHISR